MTISSTGLFTADVAAGTYTVTATQAGISGSLQFQVTDWLAPVVLSGSIVYAAIAASGSTVHIVEGNGTTSYRRSLDKGATWGAWQVLGTGTTYLDRPLAASGNNVGLITVNPSDTIVDFFGPRPVGEISVYRSTDNGTTWSARVQITSGAKALRVALTIAGSVWNAVWMDYRNNRWDIYHTRSTDNGVTWSTDALLVLGTNSVGAGRPSMVAEGNNVHLVWMDGRDSKASGAIEGGTVLPFLTESYYKRSTDGGATWGNDTRITVTSNTTYCGRPDVAVNGNNVVVACDYRETVAPNTAGNNVAIVRSGDNGTTWSNVNSPLLLEQITGDSTHPIVAHGVVAGNVFYVFWNDDFSGVKHNYMKKSTDGGVTWGARTQVSSVVATIPLAHVGTDYIHAIYSNSSTINYRRKQTA